ncbi:MAG: hypothetical protein ACJ76P_08520 [Actinomycetota bacterium]
MASVSCARARLDGGPLWVVLALIVLLLLAANVFQPTVTPI